MDHSDIRQMDWQTCPPGTLSEFAGKQKHLERRRFLMKAGGIAGGLLLAAGVGVYSYRQNSRNEYEFGGITCTELRKNAPLLMAGTLDESIIRKIDIHLSKCPNCPEYMGKMKSQMELETRMSASQNQRSVCQCNASNSTSSIQSDSSEEIGYLLKTLERVPQKFV